MAEDYGRLKAKEMVTMLKVYIASGEDMEERIRCQLNNNKLSQIRLVETLVEAVKQLNELEPPTALVKVESKEEG